MPSINGGMKLIKYLLFLFNLGLVVIGIALVWIGVSAKHGFTEYFSPILDGNNDGGHSIPPTIFIVVGSILFLIAFMGCCGAVTENHCMMMLYSVLVGLILVIQLGGAVAAYAFQDDVENVLESRLKISQDQYYNDSSEFHNNSVKAWNMLQHNLECCGVYSYADWINATAAPAVGFIPESCCIGGAFTDCAKSITKDNIGDITVAEKAIYTVGCLPKGVSTFAIDHMGTIGIIFAVVQFLAIICACMMARSIRFSYETV